jgi:hypothetical protein
MIMASAFAEIYRFSIVLHFPIIFQHLAISIPRTMLVI